MVERRIATQTTMPSAELALERPSADQLVVRLAGPWRMSGGVPDPDAVAKALSDTPAPHQIAFQAEQLGGWDSALLTFLDKIVGALRASTASPLDRSGLPTGVQRLLDLAEAVPERKGARDGASGRGCPGARRHWRALAGARRGARLPRLPRRDHARLRRRCCAGARASALVDLLLYIQQAGADALPIVTLISFLVGADPGVRRRRAAAAVRRRDLRRRPGRHRHGARDGRDDDRHRHGRPHRRRLRRAARHDEGHAGDRRADDHGHLADRVPGAAAHARAVPDDAAALPLRRPASASSAAPVVGVGMLDLTPRVVLPRRRSTPSRSATSSAASSRRRSTAC